MIHLAGSKAKPIRGIELLFRENAKALHFDALLEKKVICTGPRENTHPALQLDPRKRTYPRGGVGKHLGPPRPPIAALRN
jgi:hypothetical protein